MAIAALFVIIFGIRYTATITTPLLFGLFLAILSQPAYQALIKRGLTSTVSLIITILGLSAILLSLGIFTLSAFRSIQTSLSTYRTELIEQLETLNVNTQNLSNIAPPEQLSDAMVHVLGNIVSAAASITSTLIIAVVVAAMFTIEAPRLKRSLSYS